MNKFVEVESIIGKRKKKIQRLFIPLENILEVCEIDNNLVLYFYSDYAGLSDAKDIDFWDRDKIYSNPSKPHSYLASSCHITESCYQKLKYILEVGKIPTKA